MASDQQSELDLFAAPEPAERQVTSHFLGWHRPLLELATDHLSRDWESGPLDLSRLVLIVPTRNASRRLRECLAIHASQKKTGVLSPLILNPDDLLVPPSDALPTATKAESLAAWIEVLLEADLPSLTHLFPVEPVAQNFSWALATAKELLSVQSLLGEGAHNASYAAKVLGGQDIEPERWQELAQLERATFRKLEKAAKQARVTARRQAIDSWTMPDGYDQLILLGLPDPPPALEPLIDRVTRTLPVQILIHAPESEAEHFDWLGKPLDTWSERPLTIPDESIFQCSSPSAQADRACQLLQDHDAPHQLAAIGVPDPEVIAPLQKSLASKAWASFDPAGEPLSRQGICHLLRTLRDLSGSRLLATFRDLLRIPGIAESAGSFQVPEGKNAFPPDAILEAFDAFHESHLCESISDALSILDNVKRNKALIVRSLQWMNAHLDALEKEPLSTALPHFLSEVYQNLKIEDEDRFATITQSINQTISDIATLTLPNSSGAERFQLFLSLLEEQVLASKRLPEAIDLPGWLELPWEDAPHLILTGCNDGLVPESIQSHPWLPNQARLLLGLRHNASRQARDSYLMAALIASRKDHGQLDLLFGRVNSQNDPLRPSRLLLATPTEQLPDRVNLLFRETESDSVPLPWKMAWQLTPPVPDPKRFQKISVTAFSSYLDCPFRYYLQYGVKMREPDLDRMELNPRDFGTLTHDVLEDFAKTPAATSDSAKEIRECFDDLLTTKLTNIYGTRLSAPLLIQASSIRQRLNWWADHEAQSRVEGWTILETETYLAPKETPFSLGNMPISGMIDRIETHPDHGLRILDFKTKKKPTPVIKAHLRALKRSEKPKDFPTWQLTSLKGKAMLWTNLQIPLYLLALANRFPKQDCVSGYVQLGASKGDIHFDLWHTLDHELLESAEKCALGVIESIQKQVFWPPTAKPNYDNFADLLFGDPLTAINFSHLKENARS